MNLERGSALNDKRVKQQFATIPSEVWNVAAIDKITGYLEGLGVIINSSMVEYAH